MGRHWIEFVPNFMLFVFKDLTRFGVEKCTPCLERILKVHSRLSVLLRASERFAKELDTYESRPSSLPGNRYLFRVMGVDQLRHRCFLNLIRHAKRATGEN